MSAVNGTAVALARESRGWTQSDLAKAIGVTQAKICKYELDLLPVSESDLPLIAAVLNFDLRFFSNAEIVLGLGGDFLYRRQASVSSRTRRRIEAEANIRKLQVGRLIQSARLESEYEFPAIQPEECDGRIDLIAERARKAWRIPAGPIRNLTRILELSGAIIFTVNFESDLVDGTNIRTPGLPPMMFLNKYVSGERHRFNLAHECGHLIMHYTTVLGDAESEANAFANEFLMPKSAIRSDLKNLDLAAAARLKSVWGVSMAAIIRRAHSLELITDSKYHRLFTMLSGQGFRRQEPFPIEFEQPESFDRLVKWHKENLHLSNEELRSVLFTDYLGPLEVPNRPPMRIVPGLFE